MNILDKEAKKIKIDNEYFSNIKKKTYPIIKNFENFYKILNKKQNDALEKYKNSTDNIYSLLNTNTLFLMYYVLLSSKKISNGGSLYSYINDSYLKIKKQIESIDSIFTIPDTKLKRKLTVFRGEGNSDIINNIKHLKIGETIKYKSFLSTSIDPQITYRFSSNSFNNNSTQSRILLAINITKNENIVYLPWFFDIKNKNLKKEKYLSSELEILLQRGCILKLKNIKKLDFYKKGIKNINWATNLNKKQRYLYIYIFNLVGYEPEPIPDFNSLQLTISPLDKVTKHFFYFDVINSNKSKKTKNTIT